MQIINPTVDQIIDYINDTMTQDEQDEYMEEVRSALYSVESENHFYDRMADAQMHNVRGMDITLHCGPAVLSDTLIVDSFEFHPTNRFHYQGHIYYVDGPFALSPKLHNERLAELLENYEENSK